VQKVLGVGVGVGVGCSGGRWWQRTEGVRHPTRLVKGSDDGTLAAIFIRVCSRNKFCFFWGGGGIDF
jgi:hypothetical protein